MKRFTGGRTPKLGHVHKVIELTSKSVLTSVTPITPARGNTAASTTTLPVLSPFSVPIPTPSTDVKETSPKRLDTPVQSIHDRPEV